MAPYSMDLRTRVLRDWDAGMKADAVGEKDRVSRVWVHRLQQRRREAGEIAPRKQTRWRTPILTAQLSRLEAVTATRRPFIAGAPQRRSSTNDPTDRRSKPRSGRHFSSH